MLIDVGLPAICVILPPAPSLLQEDSSDACVSIDALASAAERLRSDGLCGSYAKADTGSMGDFRPARREVVHKSASGRSPLISSKPATHPVDSS